MKKVFLSAFVLLMTIAAISCSKKEENTATAADNQVQTNGTDTLSYIAGMEAGNIIESEFLTFFNANYDVLLFAFEKALNNETVEIDGELINKENLDDVMEKYANSDFESRMMSVMYGDTTVSLYNNDKERNVISATMAVQLGSSFDPRIKIDSKSAIKAINDVHNGTPMFTNEFAMEFSRNYFTVVIPEQNRKLSEEWLASIEQMPGVEKTASGILYRIENAGNPDVKAINDADVVEVLYTGRTKDGNIFDTNRWNDKSSEEQKMYEEYLPEEAGKDSPIEFALNQVIKGWTEGMKLIGKGGRITLWIPSELAYGEIGAGQDIGPNEALCFDVELLNVTNK